VEQAAAAGDAARLLVAGEAGATAQHKQPSTARLLLNPPAVGAPHSLSPSAMSRLTGIQAAQQLCDSTYTSGTELWLFSTLPAVQSTAQHHPALLHTSGGCAAQPITTDIPANSQQLTYTPGMELWLFCTIQPVTQTCRQTAYHADDTPLETAAEESTHEYAWDGVVALLLFQPALSITHRTCCRLHTPTFVAQQASAYNHATDDLATRKDA
jgi:hypothetical protein